MKVIITFLATEKSAAVHW